MLLHGTLVDAAVGRTSYLKRFVVLLTPHRIILVLRAVTGLSVCAVLILTLGPFQGLEARIGLSDKAAHALAFYILTLLLFSIAPRRRRTDLALAALALGILIELSQGLTGRSLSILDFLADALGVAAATAPAWIERFRHSARRRPFLVLGAAEYDRHTGPRSGRGAPANRPVSGPVDGWR